MKTLLLNGITLIPMKIYLALLLTFTFIPGSCQRPGIPADSVQQEQAILPGAFHSEAYLHLLTGKKVAVVANQTSLVGNVHLVDTLISSGIEVKQIFSPEHGFRGNAPDGELIKDQKDVKTGIPVISLYGAKKKPNAGDLEGIDVVVFDIQDVGCRFYTYISTLAYVMESCAENGVQLLLLDRPNPNGFYMDGPVLEKAFSSFVGLHPVPVVYGMTIGEYALMANGEGWLIDGAKCSMMVIPCSGYTHQSRYRLPVKPSPNLPEMSAVYLYPSLCLFEGTVMSVGRGTGYPFQCYGHPGYTKGSFSFKPESLPTVSVAPPYEGVTCNGRYLGEMAENLDLQGRLNLQWLLDAYTNLNLGDKFFTPYFEKLSGTGQLRKQVEDGMDEESIRTSWQPGLEAFSKIRVKYLIYK